MKDSEHDVSKTLDDKIVGDIEYIIKNLCHASKTARRTSSYVDKEVGLRVVRDSLRLYPLLKVDDVVSHLSDIISINGYRKVPQSFNYVVEDLNVFTEKLQKDLMINPWGTQWSKRKTFITNFIQHCKDKIHNRYLGIAKNHG